MTWIGLSLCSALVLGVYELMKKLAVRNNAVPPVLFVGVLTGAMIWGLLRVITPLLPAPFREALQIDPLTPGEHFFLFGKGLLVSASWVFGYFALKHLPITLAGPIRSSAPLWTVLLAVLVLGEAPGALQWLGIGIILSAFYAFSLIGRGEGIVFHRDKWFACLLLATILGAVSAIYDKYLLQSLALGVATLQFWFSMYLLVVMTPFVLVWRFGLRDRGRFEWRWIIPLVGILLLITDALYFAAISGDGALISVISPIRRTSVIVGFIGGIVLLGERRNIGWKSASLVLMLVGVVILNWKSR
jgi:bacterial/archaeal transporter family protein